MGHNTKKSFWGNVNWGDDIEIHDLTALIVLSVLLWKSSFDGSCFNQCLTQASTTSLPNQMMVINTDQRENRLHTPFKGYFLFAGFY